MLTHGNLASNIACSLDGFSLADDEVSISFLPLSHVTARHVDFALLYRGVALAYCPDMSKLEQVLSEVQPVIFVAVRTSLYKHHTPSTDRHRASRRTQSSMMR